MKCRYESDSVPVFNHSLQLPCQLPVGVIDQDEDSWTPAKHPAHQRSVAYSRRAQAKEGIACTRTLQQ